MLLPGVIDTTTNYVEHPEVVANRICEAVDAVGDRDAGHRLERLRLRHLRRLGDGGRGRRVAKLSCREGADIATKRGSGEVTRRGLYAHAPRPR